MKRTIPSEAYTQSEIGWLVGIIEGEGSIANYESIYYSKRKDRKNKIYKRRVRLYGIVVVNSDLGILNEVSRIYDKMDIFSHINRKSASTRQHPKSFKPTRQCYEMAVRRRDDVEKLCRVIIPYMQGEKRMKTRKLLRDLVASKNSKYNKYARVETEREAPLNLKRMKLQSELSRNVKS